jgi:hypothetical protein
MVNWPDDSVVKEEQLVTEILFVGGRGDNDEAPSFPGA